MVRSVKVLVLAAAFALAWCNASFAQKTDASGNLLTNCAVGCGGGSSAVFGPTASGSPSANPPVQIGGTTTGAAGANVAGAAVKPASTAAVATDTSLVMQINPLSPGVIANAAFGTPNTTQVLSVQTNDPCTYAAKSSVPINIVSATTTSLVALSGTTAIYVCGFSVTLQEIVASADTILFESGTGAACVTTQAALTGVYGSGGITAGVPTVISYGSGISTIFKTPASGVLCAVTAGTTVNAQGVLTFVQQ